MFQRLANICQPLSFFPNPRSTIHVPPKLLSLDVDNGGTQMIDDIACDKALLTELGSRKVACVAVNVNTHPHAAVGRVALCYKS